MCSRPTANAIRGADIWGLRKDSVTHRIYITDANGIVLLDSSGQDVGRNYSLWNDVYRTLHGSYGARSTAAIPGDERSTVMHVAAPVFDGGRIIGVVTVAKPNYSLQPFIARAERRLVILAAGYILAGLVIGGLLSWWVANSIPPPDPLRGCRNRRRTPHGAGVARQTSSRSLPRRSTPCARDWKARPTWSTTCRRSRTN